MEPRRSYGGHPAWTDQDDQLLLTAQEERAAFLLSQVTEGRDGKRPRLAALDWDAIAEDVKQKGGKARSGGAHKARWKNIESGSRSKGGRHGPELGARTRKRSFDDAYDYEETPSKRRASVGSTSAASGMASATRSFSNAGLEEQQDPDYSPTSPSRQASPSIPFVHEDIFSKRPWQPTEDSLLIALKTGAATKRLSYAQLVDHFPGRGGASIAARWGKIRGKLETRKEIGANKRRARDEARDRTIQATLTGPPRLTWAVFEKRMRASEGWHDEMARESEDNGNMKHELSASEDSIPSSAPQSPQAQGQPFRLVTRIDQLLNSDEATPTPPPCRPAPSQEPVLAATAAAPGKASFRPPHQHTSAPKPSNDSQRAGPPCAAPYAYPVPLAATAVYPYSSFHAVSPFRTQPAPHHPFAPTANPPVWPSLPRSARERVQGSLPAPQGYSQALSSGAAATKPLLRREGPTFADPWSGRAGLK